MNDKELVLYTKRGTFRKGPDGNWTPITNTEYGLPELTVTSSRPIQTGDFKNRSKLIKEMGGEKSEIPAHRVVNGLGLKQSSPEFDVLGLTYGTGLGNKIFNSAVNKTYNKGANYLVNRSLNKAINKGVNNPQQIPLNLGWAPKQTISVTHKSNSPTPLTLWNPSRWDVVNEGAPANGVWFLGKLGTPRTELTNPGKGIKAVKARLLFADRPYTHEGLLTLEKPMLTVGEVPNRATVERFADLQGADGLIFNNVYDNGYNHNLVIFSLKLPFKRFSYSKFPEEVRIPADLKKYIYDLMRNHNIEPPMPPIPRKHDNLKLPKKSGLLDVNEMSPEIRLYFTRKSPYKESLNNIDVEVIGEYQNPKVLVYYDNIVKPLLEERYGIQHNLLVKPIKVMKYKEQPRYIGLHNPKTNEDFVGQNVPRPKNTQIHEEIGHGTEDLVNLEDYNLYYDIDNNPTTYEVLLPKELGQRARYDAYIPLHELRATFEEARGHLYDEACKQYGRDLTLDEFRNYIDNLSDLTTFKSMYADSSNRILNGYTSNMVYPFENVKNVFREEVAPPKDLVSKYKTLYKTLPIIGVPTIIRTLLNKKGEP